MAHVLTFVKYCTAALSGLAGFLWGELDGLLVALLVFIAADYITGLAVGLVQRKLSSNASYKGLARKGVILIIVAVGHILDAHVLGAGSLCRSAVIGWYLSNEGLSILENAGKLGVKYPPLLQDALEQLKDKKDGKGGESK